MHPVEVPIFAPYYTHIYLITFFNTYM